MISAKIKNAEALATSKGRADALQIAEAGLQAIDTETLVKKAVTLEGDQLCINESICSIKGTKRIFVVGIGKCAVEAAQVLEKILGSRLEGGIVLDVTIPAQCTLQKIMCVVGTHPFPSQANIEATKRIVALLKNLTKDDLVIFAISGGGSTFLCAPEESGITCVDEGVILRELFRGAATIYEINTVRKHISTARGGHLAKYAYPAQVISLIFSDVPGAQLEFVASGPTVRDTTTAHDAERILEKYKISRVDGLARLGLIETPKEEKYFTNVRNILIASNEYALGAMTEKARELGYASEIVSSCLEGEAQEMGKKIAHDLHEATAPRARLYGGETTVTIRGKGNGGRNRELVLAALPNLAENEVVLSIASDGWDHGPYAGAIGDVQGFMKAGKMGISIDEYLSENNSELFFKQTEDYIITGATGSNVSDLIIALKST